MALEDEVEKELAKVDAAAARGLRGMRVGFAGWVVAALLALAAAAVVFWVRASHSGAPAAAKAGKPVSVHILPPAPAKQ